MTYACNCGWSVQLEDGVEHKDVFLNHFNSNKDIHRINTVEHEDRVDEN